jgi:hypothetical protein
MFCQGCGTEFAPGATFCSQCGRPKPGSGNEAAPQPMPTTQYQMMQAPQSSGLAVGALVAAIFIPILGLILGYVARNDIRSSNPPKGGDGLATAAIVIGWIFTILGFFSLIFFIFFWAEFMPLFLDTYSEY